MNNNQIQASIASRFSSRKKAVEKISKWLHLSPAAIYNRLSGKTSFTLEEMQILAGQLGQSWCIRDNDDHAHIVAQYGVLNGLNRTPLEYLKEVAQFMEKVANRDKLSFTYVTSGLPPFLMFHKRHLAAFKFYHWANSTWMDDQDFELYKFDTLLHLEELHEKAKYVSDFVSAHTVCEFYQGEILAQTIVELDYYRNFLRSDSSFQIKKIKNDLLEVVEALKLRCATPQSDRQVFLINVKRLTDTILMEMDRRSLMFISFDEPHYIEIDDQGFIEHFQKMKTNMKENSTCISGMNRLERTNFFSNLEYQIDKIPE